MLEQESNDWKKMTEDNLIGQLVPDPNNPDVNVLSGILLGKGTDEKTVRLYTNLQLNQYFQIASDKILGAKRFHSGRIVIWIPADLKVQLITSNTISGDYLKGSIQNTYSKRAGTGNPLSQVLAAFAQGGGGTSWGGCPSDLPGDPSCPIPTTSSPPLCGPNPPSGCGC